MNTGCKQCDKNGLCDKHKLEYLEHEKDTALNAYMEELRMQSSKKGKKE